MTRCVLRLHLTEHETEVPILLVGRDKFVSDTMQASQQGRRKGLPYLIPYPFLVAAINEIHDLHIRASKFIKLLY